jgi:hypothetical protein
MKVLVTRVSVAGAVVLDHHIPPVDVEPPPRRIRLLEPSQDGSLVLGLEGREGVRPVRA